MSLSGGGDQDDDGVRPEVPYCRAIRCSFALAESFGRRGLLTTANSGVGEQATGRRRDKDPAPALFYWFPSGSFVFFSLFLGFPFFLIRPRRAKVRGLDNNGWGRAGIFSGRETQKEKSKQTRQTGGGGGGTHFCKTVHSPPSRTVLAADCLGLCLSPLGQSSLSPHKLVFFVHCTATPSAAIAQSAGLVRAPAVRLPAARRAAPSWLVRETSALGRPEN